MDWETHARRLAADTVHPSSRWYQPIATTPRHLFVPCWWERVKEGRIVRDGIADTEAWLRTAYSDDTLVTRLGPLHADTTEPGTVTPGRATSSSTLPTLVVMMYRHAMITDDSDILVTCGSGYGTALACRRLGDTQVTSVDVDPYLVTAAQERLKSIGLHPHLAVCDLTGELPGRYDRIVSTVSVQRIPPSWLAALRPGGRLVTTIAKTGLLLVADKTEDGGAAGFISEEKAAFMQTRHGDDYADDATDELFRHVQDAQGESVTTSRYPLLYVPDAWEVWSMMELAVPGIEYRWDQDDKTRTVWLLHPDGSWARATADGYLDSPEVHQGGPRPLWDELERIRHRLNREGGLPVYGARARIAPDGTIRLKRGQWTATIR
ncbi:methyltransferase domain-containing protein [Streptomyces sp. NBC_00648]|uniref:methyltransferase domain-containing protein n=1 Tax=Streptomyces sp. NBC_00648 TaxID=2975797 RepID=UPI00324DF87E